jgi:hypothetical protein
MRKLSSLKACVAAAGFALLGASGAQADTVLLSLINPPPYHITSYSLSFVATAADTTLSVGGYQVNTDEVAYDKQRDYKRRTEPVGRRMDVSAGRVGKFGLHIF